MKKIITIGALVSVAFTLTACTPAPKEVTFQLNKINETLDVHTDFQKQFLTAADGDSFVKQHEMELATFSKSAPNKFDFSFSITADNGVKPTKSYVCVDDGKEVYKFETKTSTASVTNLKVGTSYTWYVESFWGKTSFKSETSTFTTSDSTPRNIFVEGMENVRDLGGYNVGNGKMVKQGLIYRSAELNGDKNGLSKPTSAGKATLLDQLKIKSEIDLRKTKASFDNDEVNGITSSPLGKSVSYVSCPMNFGHSNIFSQEKNLPSIKKFFDTLADEANYPMVFHCVRGTDRTGALAYVVDALCGVAKEDLIRDYVFSNFANINSAVVTFDDINKGAFYPVQIESCEGATLAEKTKNYLISKEVATEETLNKIVSILVA